MLLLAVLLINHRLAFLALTALLLGAAIPLAFAWARVIPDDRTPFQIDPPRSGRRRDAIFPPPLSSNRDTLVIVPILFVTLAYIVQFPGFPRQAALQWLGQAFSAFAPFWMSLGARVLAGVVTVGVASHALSKPDPLRIPLGVGAVLVLLLWLTGSFLRTALLFGP